MQIVSYSALSNPEFGLFLVLQARIIEELFFKLTFVKRETAPAFPEILRRLSFRLCSDAALNDVALNDVPHQFSVDYVTVAIVNESYYEFFTQLLLDAAVKRLVK